MDFREINTINASYLMNIIISRSSIHENYFKTSVIDKQKAGGTQSTNHLDQSLKTYKNDIKQTDDLIVMFGTYRAEVKKMMFNSASIELVGMFESNGNKIIIPFKQINYLLYCTQDSQISLFIRPNTQFNDQIKRSLNIIPNYFGNLIITFY